MRLSHLGMRRPLGLRRLGEIARSDRAREILAFVSTIAERLICGVTAATNCYRGATTQAEFLASLIDNFKVTLDTDRAIIEKRHFGACHECLR